MQRGSAKGSIESIIEQVLAIRLSAGVKSQDSRREARRLGAWERRIASREAASSLPAKGNTMAPAGRGHLSLSTRRLGTPCSQPGKTPFGKQP